MSAVLLIYGNKIAILRIVPVPGYFFLQAFWLIAHVHIMQCSRKTIKNTSKTSSGRRWNNKTLRPSEWRDAGKGGTMEYPKTKDEWWSNVDERWSDLLGILKRYINPKKIDDAIQMKENRNPCLAQYFNSAWFNAPDCSSIHSIPAWGVLCDLCSEDHVLSKV